LLASVTVSRAAHLFCYINDANGNIVRLQPNHLSASSLVSANQAIRLPDWMVPFPAYVINAGAKGHEALMCIASDEDPMTRMPTQLNMPALTPITAVQTLDQLRREFESAVGEKHMAAQTLEWNILPPPPQPAAKADAAATSAKPQ